MSFALYGSPLVVTDSGGKVVYEGRTGREEMKRKSRIVVEKDGVQISLPMSDAQMMHLKKPGYCNMFLPIHSARCLIAEAGGMDLRKKLPSGVWVQEMNLLAYILQKFDLQQMERFQRKLSSVSRMCTGEMLNCAFAICPEAAGFEKGSRLCPQYSGENLFDLMEYKRFQDWRQEHGSFQIAKFYFPVEVVWHSDQGSDFMELTSSEAAAYHSQISERIARYIQPDTCWSDWEGYDRLFELEPYKEHGLLYERPDVEIWNGELWGVIVTGVNRQLTETDKRVLKAHFDGGIWDGWGENSLRVPVPEGYLQLFLSDCTEVHQQAEGEMVLTEQEMFLCQAPYFKSRLLPVAGWETDFRGEREYGDEHPIWLELSKNRRRIRIPLPAESGGILEDINKIPADMGTPLRMWVKTREIFPINNDRVSEQDIPVLNQIAERVQELNGDEIQEFYKILQNKKWGSENRVKSVQKILELFPRRAENEYGIGPMGMG